MKKTLTILTFLILAILISSCKPEPKEMKVTFSGAECSYSGPQKIPAGKNTITVDVQKDIKGTGGEVAMLTMEEGKTAADLEAWAEQGPPPWVNVFAGEAQGIDPGNVMTRTFSVDGTTSPFYIVCFDSPQTRNGVLGPFEVEK